jgi:hypothetical protein
MQNAKFKMQTIQVRKNGVNVAAPFTPLAQTICVFAF